MALTELKRMSSTQPPPVPILFVSAPTPLLPISTPSSSLEVAISSHDMDSHKSCGEWMRTSQRKAMTDRFTKLTNFLPDKHSKTALTCLQYTLIPLFSLNLTRDEIRYRTADGVNHDIFPHWKFAKFLLLTFVAIVATRYFTKAYKMEYDTDQTWEQFIMIYLLPVMQDSTLWFLLGRLHVRRGVDCLNYILPLSLGAWFMTAIGIFDDMHASLSQESIERDWTKVTWVGFFGGAAVTVVVMLAHMYKMVQDGLLAKRVVELGGVACVAVLPVYGNENFHPHHWFVAWFGGMHLNLRYEWSFWFQGLVWGIYVNGIAVYGRDNLLGCLEDKYRSLNDGCPVWEWSQ